MFEVRGTWEGGLRQSVTGDRWEEEHQSMPKLQTVTVGGTAEFFIMLCPSCRPPSTESSTQSFRYSLDRSIFRRAFHVLGKQLPEAVS